MGIVYWLRWLAALPSAIVGSLIANALGVLFNGRYVPDWYLASLLFQIWQGIILGAAFVWIGALVAPAHRFVSSVILAMVFSLFVGATITISFLNGDPWSERAVLLAHILGSLGGAAGTCFYFHSKEKPTDSAQVTWDRY